MRELEVDTGMLQSCAGSMEEYVTAFAADLEALKESIDSLNGSWEGEAQKEFASQFAKDYEVMKQVEEILKELQQTMAFAQKEYVQCEQSMNETVAAIRI